jgi:hypothetical protein
MGRKLQLLKASDSSWVATIDSISISGTSTIYPGNGLNSNYAAKRLPLGLTNQDVIAVLSMERGFQSNGLERSISQVFTKENSIPQAEKRVEHGFRPQVANRLEMTVQPNPVTGSALISVKAWSRTPTVLELTDVLGRSIQTIYQGEIGDGELQLVLEAGSLTAGTYFIRMLSGGEVLTRKVQVVK